MQNKNILVIEDEEFAIALLEKILTDEGYNVSKAMNKKEALSKINNNKYDLIISDIMLPYAGGFDIVDDIKDDEQKKNTPVLILTGMDREILDATLIKANAYMTKPYDVDELIGKVKDLLSD